MRRTLLALLLSVSLLTDATWAVTPAKIVQAGPGARIAGIDISHWQHPGDAPIDFTQMYSAGVRFVMIKGADAQTAADAVALKFLIPDRKAAQ